MTIAYWRLNQIIVDDAFPVPNIDGIKSRLGTSTLFTVGDARGMYYQIPGTERACKVLAVILSHGLFGPLCLPQGVCIGPAVC